MLQQITNITKVRGRHLHTMFVDIGHIHQCRWLVDYSVFPCTQRTSRLLHANEFIAFFSPSPSPHIGSHGLTPRSPGQSRPRTCLLRHRRSVNACRNHQSNSITLTDHRPDRTLTITMVEHLTPAQLRGALAQLVNSTKFRVSNPHLTTLEVKRLASGQGPANKPVFSPFAITKRQSCYSQSKFMPSLSVKRSTNIIRSSHQRHQVPHPSRQIPAALPRPHLSTRRLPHHVSRPKNCQVRNSLLFQLNIVLTCHTGT